MRLTIFWALGIKGLNQLNKISTLQLDNNNITCRGATALLNSVNNKSDSAIKEIHCIVGTLRCFFFCCIAKENSEHYQTSNMSLFAGSGLVLVYNFMESFRRFADDYCFLESNWSPAQETSQILR